MDTDQLATLFEGIGLTQVKAKETANNKKLAPLLEEVIRESGVSTPIEKSKGALFYTLASTISKNALPQLVYISKAIANDKLQTGDQVSAAIKFVEKAGDSIADSAFDEACGVGVVVTREQIIDAVKSLINSKRSELETKRYTMVGQLFGQLRNQLKWANAGWIKEELDGHVASLLGPKDERDDPKAKKKKEKEAAAAASTTVAKEVEPERSITEIAQSFKFIHEGELSRLHKPGGNPQLRPEIMEAHLKRTGGKVVTRFPPEPNGFLHIGHAKAININFGFAQANKGITYLRYDDTNPEAEEEKYFTAIKDTVEWLGFTPYKITYASDHFQRLYDLAVDLIKRGKAYVDHSTAEEIYAQRGGDARGPRSNSPWRDRPIEENLAEFQKMKDGRYKEGEAVLRMKMDMQHPSPQFWDLIAYRILFSTHHRTGDQWCIYPTYDFTHCLCDSFEDITHSLCTTEFVLSRESYYWLVDALELYKPVQWEYGRLNLTNAVLSKRKLNKLVEEGIVSGWDDPRLYTLAAVRRRGFTPEAINAFVREMGVTTANTVIPVERLENYVRDHLNQVSPRYFLLLEPVKVTLENVPDDFLVECSVPNKPRDSSFGDRTLAFTKTIYIDASDFKEVDDDPNFFRLAPGKTVGLLNAPFPIKATSFTKDPTGKITEIKAEYLKDFKGKVKTYIQWVGSSASHNSPVHVTVRQYSNLFHHSNPADNPDGWLADVNKESLQVYEHAMIDTGILSAKVEDKFQGVRVGYFCVDSDSKPEESKFVLNRTVSLKEDSKKDK